MKQGLAVLTIDVWADVFVYPWINRQQLAQIVDQFKELAFTEKLQTFLHDPKCGKHSLRYLKIYYKSQRRATLSIASRHGFDSIYKDCEFPEVEMPENIKTFKQLTIGHFDEQVLEFFNQTKPLFTNILLDIESTQSAKNLCILFTNLLPIIGGIRGIRCKDGCIEFLKQNFPSILAQAKELSLFDDEIATVAYIPAYLDWLSTPLDFNMHGPRFMKMDASLNTITVLVDAIRKQPRHQHLSFSLNSTTSMLNNTSAQKSSQSKIRLPKRNYPSEMQASKQDWESASAIWKSSAIQRVLVPAKMGEWRAYYQKKCKNLYSREAEPEQMISIDGYSLTVGQITKKAGIMNQDNDQPANDDKDGAGPSSSASSAKEKCACVIA